MIRDFSEEKKEELYKALNVIDIQEWKPFMEWCGGRAGEFGVWAGRLGILSYTRRIDDYQNRILDTNSSTRNQIDTIFENVAEVDKRYAGIIQGYAEKVGGQISQVQALIKVLSLVNGNDINSENYISMKDAVGQLNRSQELDYAERLLDSYLKEKFSNSVEREVIIQLIREEQFQMLSSLYVTDRYSTADSRLIVKQIIAYYEKKKINILLEEIMEKFEQDKNACSGKRFDEYLEYLQTLQYICPADVDNIRNIIGRNKQDICIFLSERMKLIESLSEDKAYGVNDKGWSKEQIMCALQIEAELTAFGCDKEFIAGFIGNVKNEGGFGLLEGVNRDGKYKGKDVSYWIHMMQCVDYYNIYNKKELTDVNLIQLYVDLIYKRENGECIDPDNHKIGIGMVQWTEQDRCDKLMSFYLEQVGYDMNSNQFSEFIQEWQRSKSKEEIYLTEEQIRNAEINMMIYELTSEDKDNFFKDFYKKYSENRSKDNQEALKDITYTIYIEYERPATDSYDIRLAAAKRWYEISSE